MLYDTLAALQRGMKAANPAAELIAWPYGQLMMWGEKMTVESARHIPKGVILQHNFETGGTNRQLGKDRPLCDYWLSVVGPSPVFRGAARAACAGGIRMSAKLQVGCSHEDATVPFVPVPGLLYDKYRILHELGVSAVMQSWYFGNYPSLMTRAAGLLSFSPLPKCESDFLSELAAREWPGQEASVVKAWTSFRHAYENYPSTHLFGYYGPVQDGVVWPLHLIPRNRPLAPTWKLGYPRSGDYVADCLSSEFTLNEVVTLCTRMARQWRLGLRDLDKAFSASEKTTNQCTEWNVAQAIGLQFECAAAILTFYQMREVLAETTGKKALHMLDAMREVVKCEIIRRQAMIDLCRQEPTLGFHSEAEGFKVTPALIRKGLRSLTRLLDGEFVVVRQAVLRNETLFGHYTGRTAKHLLLFRKDLSKGSAKESLSPRAGAIPWNSLGHFLTQNSQISGKPVRGTDWCRSKLVNSPARVQFQAGFRSSGLHLVVVAAISGSLSSACLYQAPWFPLILIDIEPRRLHPRIQFSSDILGNATTLIDDGYMMTALLPFAVEWNLQAAGWTAEIAIPFESARLRRTDRLFRFNLRVLTFNKETDERHELSWSRRSPLKPRQAWDDANPAQDYTWAKLSNGS